MAKKKSVINYEYGLTTCRCGAEFQVLKEVEVGADSPVTQFDPEGTEEAFFEHWNNECELTHAEEPAIEGTIASGNPDIPILSATPTSDTPVSEPIEG